MQVELEVRILQRLAVLLGDLAQAARIEFDGIEQRLRLLLRIAAQRVVYQALGDLMESEIHALSMRTLTPEQWADER